VGRFCLPENLAKAVGIEKKAAFVGRVDKFEIWDAKRFEKAQTQDEATALEMAKQIL
jgi:DNA-binding transcriptional regulator/RsmH inhibitor MraZ